MWEVRAYFESFNIAIQVKSQIHQGSGLAGADPGSEKRGALVVWPPIFFSPKFRLFFKVFLKKRGAPLGYPTVLQRFY